MQKKKIKQIAKNILARPFADMNEIERREYLRDHPESRWNPGEAKLPQKKKRKR